jgi:hypothetical protein
MQQQQQQQGSPGDRFYRPTQQPNLKAGMYNAQRGLGQVPSTRPGLVEPPPVPSPYSKVTVAEPLLVNSGRGGGILGLGVQPPHWTYQVLAEFKAIPPQQQPPHPWIVRRRFRHVVALEDRLRQEFPGAILPPRYVAVAEGRIRPD